MTLVGSTLYVSNTLGDSISLIDTTSQTYLRTIPVGSGPTVMTYLSGRMYTTNTSSTSISFINTAKLLGTISTGLNPTAMTALSARYLYVANSKNKSITVIDTADSNATQVSEPKINITVGNGPSASVLVGTKIYVSNTDDGTVSVINTANNTVSKTISV